MNYGTEQERQDELYDAHMEQVGDRVRAATDDELGEQGAIDELQKVIDAGIPIAVDVFFCCECFQLGAHTTGV